MKGGVRRGWVKMRNIRHSRGENVMKARQRYFFVFWFTAAAFTGQGV